MALAAKSSKSGRRATNVTISKELLDEARALNVNISRAAEYGLTLANAEKRASIWLQKNQRALDSSNQYVERNRNGLPLAAFRKF